MVAQRWRDRRDVYRRPDEQIRTRFYDVALLADDTTAKRFVCRHHYSGSYPATRFRAGLFRSGELVGAAVFSVPCRSEVLTSVFPIPLLDSVELGRFVLTDDVEGNGETWFLARAFELLRAEGLSGVLSFSDPMPREDTQHRRIVFRGHIGTIYQAHNGVYLGRSTPRTLRLLPDGTVLSARAIQKIRAGERGCRYSAALLEKFGASKFPFDQSGPRNHWLHTWLPRLTRTVRHPGNHRYAWRLRPRVPILGTPQPYPKFPAFLLERGSCC